jgi:high-affinity Fe2+/Pb2+ permease
MSILRDGLEFAGAVWLLLSLVIVPIVAGKKHAGLEDNANPLFYGFWLAGLITSLIIAFLASFWLLGALLTGRIPYTTTVIAVVALLALSGLWRARSAQSVRAQTR